MPPQMIRSDPRAREKPCLRCGYSLRKVTDGNRCPECGLSTWLSLNENDTLEMSNPEWLRRMATGLWMMVFALVPLVGVVAVDAMYDYRWTRFISEWAQAQRQRPPQPGGAPARFTLRPPVPSVWTTRACLMLGAAGLLVYHAGLIRLTSAEGRYPDRLAGFRAGAWAVGVVGAIIAMVLAARSVQQWPDAPTTWPLRLCALATAGLTWMYLNRIAQRIPRHRLAETCWWMSVVPVLSLTYWFMKRYNWPPDVVPVLYLPVAVGMLAYFAILLHRAARAADGEWAAPTDPVP